MSSFGLKKAGSGVWAGDAGGTGAAGYDVGAAKDCNAAVHRMRATAHRPRLAFARALRMSVW